MSEPLIFNEPEHETAYNQWAGNHPNGYVLNVLKDGEGEMMAHKAHCQHVRPYPNQQPPQLYTSGPKGKVCSEDRQQLKEWAETHPGYIAICDSCKLVL